MANRPCLLVLLSLFCLSACTSASTTSSAPLPYEEMTAWAARPGVVSAADGPYQVGNVVFNDGQSTADVDTFYIYPTLYLAENTLNAPVPNAEVNVGLESTLPLQAGIFNGTTRIFSPYYRQASLMAFLGSTDQLNRALEVAYSDIEAAFDYYLNHLNQGRPFVIVSHSQGSAMAIRLIQNKIDGQNVAPQLVAAYIIGEVVGDRQFDTIPPCTSSTQTGCFVTWASLLDGATPLLLTGQGNAVGNPVCINPISWNAEGQVAGKAQHLGGIPDAFNRVDEHMISAQCVNGLLRISAPVSGYANESGDYHESDLNLFYLDIRENIAGRIAAYQNAK